MPNGYEHGPDPDPQRVYETEDGQVLEVVLTSRSIIMDAWEVDHDGNDRLVGTLSRTAEEWWEYVAEGRWNDAQWR